MEALQQFDAGIFSAINGLHASYFDSLMWLVTKIATWIPMILMLVYLLYAKKGWRRTVTVVLAIGLVILIADQVSASIIKPLVERARPSHNPDLDSTIHIVNGYRQLFWHCTASCHDLQESAFHMDHGGVGYAHVL